LGKSQFETTIFIPLFLATAYYALFCTAALLESIESASSHYASIFNIAIPVPKLEFFCQNHLNSDE